jgi:hypothetical protein
MLIIGNKTFFRSRYLCIIIFIILLITGAGCKYDNQILLPSTPCDTAIVTFSGTVQPILNTYCVSCHSGPNANNGIRVENYTTVKMLISNGKLLGSITHSPGFSPMPQGANKLSECNIAKIRQWIVRGAQNN